MNPLLRYASTTAQRSLHAHTTLLRVVIGLALAAPSWVIGAAPNTPPPATPYLATPIETLQGNPYTISVSGISTNGSAFYTQGNGSKFTAAFSGTGVVVNSATFVNSTSLTVNFSVSNTASFGGRTLTVTNPDGQSTTSTVNIILVNDIPSITAAGITPPQLSTSATLSADVTTLNNQVGSVTYTYQWYENGVANGYTSKLLPPQATKAGNSYTCIITPIEGSLTGPPFTTPSVVIPKDADSNGMFDDWEIAFFGNANNNPSADNDGDGIPNNAEYLFGLNPNKASSNNAITAAPRRALAGQPTKFTYTRAANKVDGTVYKVWVSTNLQSWTEAGSIAEVVTPLDSTTESVQVDINGLTASNNLFIRVSAQ